jgi:hypothetical protein
MNKEHKNLIKKHYLDGCVLVTLPNPTFDEDETWESYKDKCNNILKENNSKIVL